MLGLGVSRGNPILSWVCMLGILVGVEEVPTLWVKRDAKRGHLVAAESSGGAFLFPRNARFGCGVGAPAALAIAGERATAPSSWAMELGGKATCEKLGAADAPAATRNQAFGRLPWRRRGVRQRRRRPAAASGGQRRRPMAAASGGGSGGGQRRRPRAKAHATVAVAAIRREASASMVATTARRVARRPRAEGHRSRAASAPLARCPGAIRATRAFLAQPTGPDPPWVGVEG